VDCQKSLETRAVKPKHTRRNRIVVVSERRTEKVIMKSLLKRLQVRAQLTGGPSELA